MMNHPARAFAKYYHGDQQYGCDPYIYHLDMVALLCMPYGSDAVTVAYLHDVIEDTEASLALVSEQFGEYVAACVAILTDEPGENRAIKKARTYQKMALVGNGLELALLVKAADRLANLRMCSVTQDEDKIATYQREHPQFVASVYRPDLCERVWNQIHSVMAQLPKRL
ncbi:MAG: HD domain-containing protein [Vibrio sp.]